MSNAYFISSPYKTCSYLRCLLPSLHGGYGTSITSLYGDIKKQDVLLSEIMNSDIIVFHRPETIDAHKTAIELKRRGKKIVFDNDDTFKMDKGNPFYAKNKTTEKLYGRNVKNHSRLVDNFIRNADAAFTTNEFLADEYRKINDNVFVLPNCIDTDDWLEPKRNEGDKVRIGFIGSTTYSNDFKNIKNYIIELDERDDVQIVIFGLDDKEDRKNNPIVADVYNHQYKFWDDLKNLEHMPWSSMEDYSETLNNLKLDILLIPRQDNYFNRCKSNVKFLEAAMCEIPVVAQGFTTNDSPYDKDINGKNGILIKDNSKWKEEVDRLIKDKELRRRMGKEAKQYVLKHYNIENNVCKWEEAFNKII